MAESNLYPNCTDITPENVDAYWKYIADVNAYFENFITD